MALLKARNAQSATKQYWRLVAATVIGAFMGACLMWLLADHVLSAPTPLGTHGTYSVPAPAPPNGGASTTVRLSAPVLVTDTHRATEVLTTKFQTRLHEKRLVSARVVADQPLDSPTHLTGVLLQLRCTDAAGSQSTSQSITNVESGGRAVQEPRLLLPSSGTGQSTCQLTSRLYGEETSVGKTSTVVIRPESTITVSSVLPQWAQEWTWSSADAAKLYSTLVRPGQSQRAMSTRSADVPAHTVHLRVQADHKVTVCYFRGGSSDGTTPLVTDNGGTAVHQNLCQANPRAPGALVRSRVNLTRLSDAGNPCAPTVVVIDEESWVGGREHHARVNADGKVSLPQGPECGDRVVLQSWVENTPLDAGGGLDFVLHAPDERLALLPVE